MPEQCPLCFGHSYTARALARPANCEFERGQSSRRAANGLASQGLDLTR